MHDYRNAIEMIIVVYNLILSCVYIYIYICVFLPVVNRTHNFDNRPNQTCIGTIGVPLKLTKIKRPGFSRILQVLSPIAYPWHQHVRNLGINHRSELNHPHFTDKMIIFHQAKDITILFIEL